MKNHCYKFEGKIYRQEEGGSIGLDLTGVIAEIYMSWWDGQLVVLLREERMFTLFYKRYVDDINLILKIEGMEVEETTTEPRDKLIMERVREIANTIHSNIKATCDYGSNYRDGKLPVLDLKMWIGESTRDGTTTKKILYEHYMKDVSSRHLLNYRSAHPENMKINVLVNEALRIMRNCSKHLDKSVVTQHLQYFTKRMQYSGYSQEYRYEVLQRAFKVMERESQQPRETEDERKRKRAQKRKRGWYDKDKYDGVMFVEVTPNSELKHRVQDACRRNKVKVKVVEKMNRTVKSTLQRSNPFGWKPCGRTDCYTCINDIHINCRTRGCVYQIECVECEMVVSKQYRGQTGRSEYERTKEHIKKWEAKAEDSYLHKHALECHNGQTYNINIKILAQCYGKPTTRMITEAVMIDELPDENSMNSKSEWTYVKLPRVAVM